MCLREISENEREGVERERWDEIKEITIKKRKTKRYQVG